MEQAENALRKMIEGGEAGGDPAPALLERALARALPRAARAIFGCACELGEAAQAEEPVESALAALPDPALIVLLGPGPDRPVGLLWLAPLLVNALVELATAAPDTEIYRIERPPTETDAALCRPFCEALLAELAGALPEALRPSLPALNWQGHHRAAPPLALRLPGGACLRAGGMVTLQGGLRGGAAGLVLEAGLLRRTAPAPGGREDGAFAARLRESLCLAPLALRADLARIRVPLARALALAEGEVLELPAASLAEITLSGVTGPALLKGRLGQAAGMKVLTLTAPAPGMSWPGGEAAATAPVDSEAGAAPPEAPAERAGEAGGGDDGKAGETAPAPPPEPAETAAGPAGLT